SSALSRRQPPLVRRLQQGRARPSLCRSATAHPRRIPQPSSHAATALLAALALQQLHRVDWHRVLADGVHALSLHDPLPPVALRPPPNPPRPGWLSSVERT